MTGPRQRYRERTRVEIKDAALAEIAEKGAAGLALTAVAKRLGFSGPALYRYFANRDELLTELIVDGYAELADILTAAAQKTRRRPPAARLRAVADAYRGWALRAPHRYLLLAGPPVPGYVAPAETTAQASRAIAPLVSVFAALTTGGGGTELDGQFAAWARDDEQVSAALGEAGDGGAAVGRAPRLAVTAWARLHGLISLEVTGSFTGMDFDPALLFAAEVDALVAEAAGDPAEGTAATP